MVFKLADVEARYEELNRKLSQPEVFQNAQLLRQWGKEHRQLQTVVEVYRKLQKVQSDLAGHREIISDATDPQLVALAKSELVDLEQHHQALQKQLTLLLLPKDPNDDRNVILEIRSGTGGDEASLFCGDLFRMYSRLVERHGWKAEVMSMSAGSQGGFKEVIMMLEGDDVYAWLKYESGVHRVQRVPATETQGRVHTSAVTVAVLPEAEDVEVDLLEKDLRIDVYRSSGPGGQSVNTTDSAVRITHLPTGLVVACQDEKSQHKNKAKALKILGARLLDKKTAEQKAQIAAQRLSMVQTGDRSEKIRTYHFPQDRLTDHRIGLTVHNLPQILQGQLEEVITALRTHHQAQMLKGPTD